MKREWWGRGRWVSVARAFLSFNRRFFRTVHAFVLAPSPWSSSFYYDVYDGRLTALQLSTNRTEIATIDGSITCVHVNNIQLPRCDTRAVTTSVRETLNNKPELSDHTSSWRGTVMPLNVHVVVVEHVNKKNKNKFKKTVYGGFAKDLTYILF